MVISIEAKADEPFGSTLAQTLEAAERRVNAGKRSNARTRAEAMIKALISPTLDPGHLPYQLLTATVATLALAKKHNAVAALLLVHEFINGSRADGRRSTTTRKLAANAKALDGFVSVVSAGEVLGLEPPVIAGPINIRGCAQQHPAFYIGKLRTDLSANS